MELGSFMLSYIQKNPVWKYGVEIHIIESHILIIWMKCSPNPRFCNLVNSEAASPIVALVPFSMQISLEQSKKSEDLSKMGDEIRSLV